MNESAAALAGFGRQLAAGALVTAPLALASLGCGLVLGLAGAGSRLSRYGLLRAASQAYTTTVRGVPAFTSVPPPRWGGAPPAAWRRPADDGAGRRGRREHSAGAGRRLARRATRDPFAACGGSAGRSAGGYANVAPPVAEGSGLRLHLLFPRHPPAGADLSRLLRLGAVLCGARQLALAGPCANPTVRGNRVRPQYRGAYTAEIIRGGMLAVTRGEIDAAGSLGLSGWQTLRLVVLPRAVRQALPAYGNEVILMLKGSALASTITLLDLTGVARTIIARTYLAVELFALAGLIYFLLTILIVHGVRVLEKRLQIPASGNPA